MTIPWGDLPTYNTIMALAAGTGLLLVVMLGRDLQRDAPSVSVTGYCAAFLVDGTILTATGLHMTLAWPLAPAFPFDNVIFGEPALGFGVLLLVAGILGLIKGDAVIVGDDPVGGLMAILRPVSVFVLGLGLACIGIAVAGMRWRLFAAPPAEPVTGWYFADHPWVEASFISAIYLLLGLAAVAFPIAVARRGAWWRAVGAGFGLAGLALLIFGGFNYFSHIGLIVETMPSSG